MLRGICPSTVCRLADSVAAACVPRALLDVFCTAVLKWSLLHKKCGNICRSKGSEAKTWMIISRLWISEYEVKSMHVFSEAQYQQTCDQCSSGMRCY